VDATLSIILIDLLGSMIDLFSVLSEISKRKDKGASAAHLKQATKTLINLGALSSARILLSQAASNLLQAGHLWEGGSFSPFAKSDGY